jgi:hypothetical protein
MPNRYVREGIIESEAINALEWRTEVFYRRLLNRVDDFGRYTAHPSLLLASLFPLQMDKISVGEIEEMLRECEAVGLLFTYAVNRKHFLVLNKWEQGRAKTSEYPSPPEDIRKQMETFVYIPKQTFTPMPEPEQEPVSASSTETARDGANRQNSEQPSAQTDTCKHLQTSVGRRKQMLAYAPDSDSDSGTDSNSDPDSGSDALSASVPILPPASGQRAASFSEQPSIDEVLMEAQRIGLAEWKARDWFNEMEGCGWLDYNHRPIKAWRAVLARVKVKWEADGRPKSPPSRNTPHGTAALSAAEVVLRQKEYERVVEAIERIRRNAASDAMGTIYTEKEKQQLTELRARRDELKQLLNLKI